jgi:hypothetical protein
MQARSNFGAGGILALVGVIVGMVFFGLYWSRVEVVQDKRPVIPPPESGAAVVAFVRESGGFSPLGVRIADSTHYAEVQFLTGPGCTALLHSGDPWPTGYTQCSSPVKIVGQVSGLGVTASGESLVGVELTVARACFELLKPGMDWPPTLPQCTRLSGVASR